ncbi:IclR family transcriptional regulator C-terminal domain-containing protein [Phytohabitans flavus]|uniref:IclR family transcriptional regulator domain-containing protein n=1 Tax=Phytohabitans flavus TaxID=1076124 RepID=UPI001E2BA1D8|nr:IclR family transcriptional regulator C-terminal domain-containing protein [Phytohabitans flavus]
MTSRTRRSILVAVDVAICDPTRSVGVTVDDAGGEVQRNAEFVQSLERGLAVIRAFDADDHSLTLSDVAHKAGLTRAAARRFLHTLAELGYVRNDGRQFSLNPRVLELGYAYLSGLIVPELAMGHMEELASRTHESASLSVLDEEMVVYVARVPAKRIMTVQISVGTRLPAYATSMGRVLLAHSPKDWLDGYLARVALRPHTRYTVTTRQRLATALDAVHRNGYAFVDQELEEGLRSVAVPVRSPSGTVIAAMNCSTHVSRGSAEKIVAEFVPELRRTAEAIEADLKVKDRKRPASAAG